MTDKIVL